ncbi:hypothetical protein PO878_20950 [Iamia majanohamensis]|uniref:Lipoprotein n=1 Tax=Iamia majanohamensis TaxID=467976 RepID=A0AAF0BRM7_9ACTN|nr:hypothetical protein [Iamia majanohamensis]WCO66966.1 hypothetical protein PO878_20950 [Iamia majanohamensis]
MRLVPALVAGALLVGSVLAGCGREPAFEDRTARVTVDGDATTYQVDGCVLDGQTAYVVGRSDDGAVVQAVVGVEADGETGVPTSTGLTVTEDEVPVTAFGDEAWARRGETGDAPGSIDSARIRGARIQASGQAQPMAVDGSPTSADPVPVSFDARCDDPDTDG